MLKLRPFQKRFLKAALSPRIDTAVLCIPRGNGKSTLAAHLLERALTPGDDLFQRGKEVILLASNLEQARATARIVRAALGEDGAYRYVDSAQRVGITHVATNRRLRVISSSGSGAMGIVGVDFCVMDEPGAFDYAKGELMADALFGAQGKPDSPMKLVIIGTLAPRATEAGHWYYDLVHAGSNGSTHVVHYAGDPETWSSWSTIRKCNPLTAISPEFRRKLLEERDKAISDPRLAARFKSYRLNLPSVDEEKTLLTVADFKLLEGREVAPADGAPIVALDLGSNRAFSAAVAIWASGRVECLGVCPGKPSVEDQEKRDRAPRGTYRRLIDEGSLIEAEGLQVPPVGLLWDAVLTAWGYPALLVADRFRMRELSDCVGDAIPLETRRALWSEASEDIRACRRLVKDGPLSLAPSARGLLVTSLARARVAADTSGNVRMVKKGHANESRDDVAFALTLACGAYLRYPPVAVVESTGPVVVG